MSNATTARPLPYDPSAEQVQDDESETIEALIDTMRKISETTSKDYGRAVRSVHAKSHGLLRGELRVLDDLPPALAQGLFARPAVYPVVMRLSTNPGDIVDDSVSAPRGLTIKVIGVEGERLPGTENHVTQDFVTANAPAFAAPDAKAFLKNLKLLAVTTDTPQVWKKAFSAVMRGAETVVESFGGESPTLKTLGGQRETHILGETFYTQAPLRYGDHIAKLAVAPVSPELTNLTGAPLNVNGKPNGLREAVVDFFSESRGEWEVRVLLCTDLEMMPVEDASAIWPEDQSPYAAVARINVQPQSAWSETRVTNIDDGLSFSPWHGLAAHPAAGLDYARAQTRGREFDAVSAGIQPARNRRTAQHQRLAGLGECRRRRANCHHDPQMTMRARIVETGLIDCFDEDLKAAKGARVDAEISAVVYDGRRLVFASDKPIPGAARSAVFSLDYTDGALRPETFEYHTAPLIKAATKYEDFALTPDGKYVIAATGFDRIEPDSAELDLYNMLLIWPAGRSQVVRIVAPTTRAGVTSSVSLRKDISRILGGAPYFKIEGLTTLPGDEEPDRLLFGIREFGESHENFEYTMKVISSPYRIENDELAFIGDFTLVYDYDPAPRHEIAQTVGLSSIEYDAYLNRMLLLTSFEEPTRDGKALLGGYLWTISIEDFEANRSPTPFVADDGTPLRFVNKPEGVAVLDETHLFVVFDNDRALGLEDETSPAVRHPHQAPYAILELE